MRILLLLNVFLFSKNNNILQYLYIYMVLLVDNNMIDNSHHNII